VAASKIIEHVFRSKQLEPHHSSLFLIKSGRKKGERRPGYQGGEIIPYSGIYQVIHYRHRLPHEVTLLRSEQFSSCAKCHDAVIFEVVRPVGLTDESLAYDPHIRLNPAKTASTSEAAWNKWLQIIDPAPSNLAFQFKGAGISSGIVIYGE